MEQIVTLKSPGKVAFFLASLLLLIGLLVMASLVDPVIHFTDPNLEKAIREKLEQPTAPLTRLDLLAITSLDASYHEIKRLDGIEALRRLAVLNLEGNAVEDVSPLARLGMLAELNLQNNQITNLDSIKFHSITHLPLRVLILRSNVDKNRNRLSDITLLNELSQIETLDLGDNFIENIEPLSELTTLKELNLRGNRIRNLQALAHLTGLVYLNIHTNPVETGLDALSNLTSLQTLIMRNVYIGGNYQFLGYLTNLQRLNIRNSGIADLTVLSELMRAGALQDSPNAGVYATIDILEVEPPSDGPDPYLSLRPYWDNVSYRYPVDLPYYPSAVDAPVFSHQSGFYTDSFSLTITSAEPDGTIFYTLDGSVPSLTPDLEPMGATNLYAGPVLIQSRAGEPNQLSNIVTDKWKQYLPVDEVFKATVVRAMLIDKTGLRSNVLTQTYFVNQQMSARYTLPIISIVTSPENLFDDEVGIYALGNLYEELYPDEPWRNPANFLQRGLKWERPGFFQMFSPDGTLLVAQNIGIRINGGFSRSFSPKSLRLYARTEYDERDLFEYNFFPGFNGRLGTETAESFKSLILRNGGNDMRGALFRDSLAQGLLESTRMDIQSSQPVIVFIDGEYWGIHMLRPRYDEYYFETLYGIHQGEVLVLKNGRDDVYFGNYTNQGNNFSNLFALIEAVVPQDDSLVVRQPLNDPIYREIEARVDIDNFITYYVSQIYFDNTDWPRTNIYTWVKTTNPGNQKTNIPYGHDGKMRWMFTDIDFGFRNPEHDNLARVLVELSTEPPSYLLRALLENEKFKIKFLNQFADHLNTIFREEVVAKQVDEMKLLYFPEIEDHIQRWGIPGKSLSSWEVNVESVRQFALLRPAYQRQHILKYFGLPGIATIYLQADTSQGYIRINTINIVDETVGVDDPNNWSGIYFQGIPVDVTAVPLDGYRFVRWEMGDGKVPDSESPKLSLTLDAGLTLLAIFSPIEDK